MKIYLLDEYTHDELGTPSLFYEVEEWDLPSKTKCAINVTN